jgi:hypothetical protein
MLEIIYKFLALILLAVALKAQEAPPQTSPHMFFLVEDEHRKQWCAYSSESSWKSQVDSLDAATVATMNFSDDHLAAIDITSEDEAGDWMVFDQYALSNHGDVQELRRMANILPGDRSVVETYLIVNGNAKLQNRTTTSLRTGEKLTSPEDWLPEVRVFTRLRDFPFARLTTVRYSDALSKGKICVPTR